MDPDFTALASRVAARAEVLGCVILSRDGLVLGAFPPHGEQDITPGLLRFAALGDPDRGFAQFPDELWAYVREGSYAAFAVAERGTRPGILLDYLEQALLVAEEARQFGQAMSEPVHVDLSQKGIGLGRRLRAATTDTEEDFRAAVAAPEREAASEPDHRPDPVPVVPAVDDSALDEALAAAVAAGGERPDGGGHDRVGDGGGGPAPELRIAPVEEVPHEVAAETPQHAPESWEEPAPPAFDQGGDPQGHDHVGDGNAPQQAPSEQPPAPPTQPPPDLSNPDEIDRVALAREFAQLLQEGPGGADE